MELSDLLWADEPEHRRIRPLVCKHPNVRREDVFAFFNRAGYFELAFDSCMAWEPLAAALSQNPSWPLWLLAEPLTPAHRDSICLAINAFGNALTRAFMSNPDDTRKGAVWNDRRVDKEVVAFVEYQADAFAPGWHDPSTYHSDYRCQAASMKGLAHRVLRVRRWLEQTCPVVRDGLRSRGAAPYARGAVWIDLLAQELAARFRLPCLRAAAPGSVDLVRAWAWNVALVPWCPRHRAKTRRNEPTKAPR